MKRLCFWLACIVALLSLQVGASAAPPVPPTPTDWVTDTNGFLSDSVRQALNTRLETYEHTSKHQVLVWIGKTTSGNELEDWTVRSFKAWKVGRKGLDDGLILFVFSDDHTARIEVGYGLESTTTDSATARILRDTILPKIKAGDHDGAVTGGVDQLLNLVSPGLAHPLQPIVGAAAPRKPAPAQPMGWFEILVLALLAIAFVLLAIRHPVLAYFLLSFFGRSGGGGGGGFNGGGGRSGGGGASGKW